MSASIRGDKINAAKRKRLHEATQADKAQRTLTSFLVTKPPDAPSTEQAESIEHATPAVGICVEVETTDSKAQLDAFTQIATNAIQSSQVELVHETSGKLSLKTTPVAAFAGIGQHVHTAACSHGTEDDHVAEPVQVATAEQASSSGHGAGSIEMPDLPPLPPPKGRKEGKYISKGNKQNGFKPTVVYYNGGKQAISCCVHGDCHIRPCFGPIGTFGSQHAIYCAEHHDSELHEDVVSRRCIHEGCKKTCSFGPIGTFGRQHAVYCEEHHDPEKHEDVINKRCIHDGCKTKCSFGPIGMFGSQHAIYCTEHRDPELHENVVSKRCIHDGCKRKRNFGPIGMFGSQHAIYCAEHHDPILHEDIVSKRCIHEGCKTQPTFGPIGTFGRQHAIYCTEHHDPILHEDVVSTRCIHEGCKTTCNFGPIGTFGRQHAIYCAEHRDPNLHEDVVSRRCIHEGCKKTCSFGPIGTFGRQHAIYCTEHHDPNLHEEVVSKRCTHEGCKKKCSFGPIGTFGTQHAIYCSEHHDPELHEDVVSRRCIHEGCKKTCSFGPIGTFGKQHAIYCAEHHDPELHEDVVNKRCSVDGCVKHAVVHDPDDPSIHVCIACAGNLGLVDKTRAGASMACSTCFDELELHLGHKITWRERYDEQRNRYGAEKYGLLREHPRLHPDGFVECDDGSHKGTVYEYHGCFYHGYPPWHPKHETAVFRGNWGPDLYKKTMARMHLFKDAGYRVVYIWESDWFFTKKSGSTNSIGDVLREM